jgi:hypothetical protein
MTATPHWMFLQVSEGKTAKNGARLITPADPEGNEFDVIADTAVGQ